jgi:small GTP-binding protein
LCNFRYSAAPKKYKVVFIGDTQVGKTSMIEQLLNKKFQMESIATMSVDHQDYKYTGKDGKEYIFEIWDTIGQEKLGSVNKIFYQKANGIVAVYDITAKKSLNALEERIALALEVNNDKKLGDDIHMIICANKGDLYEERTINDEDGNNVAEKYKVDFFSTTATDHESVYESLSVLFEQIIKKEKSKNLKKPVVKNENPLIENEKPSITDKLIPGSLINPNPDNDLPNMDPNLRRKNNIEKLPKQNKKRCRCPCSKGKQDGDILDMM